MTAAEPGFGVYVHWPFCAQKCPYCDFNSHVRHKGWDEARFLSAYKAELTDTAQRAGTRTVSSIFFGGGTPSLMQPATTAAILDHIAGLWSLAPDCEITLEANPGSVEAGRFRGYRAAGVNRVSVGLQSLRDEELKRLGRIHTVAEARAALDVATSTFDRVSFDLIYARPGQTAEAWRAELGEALALRVGHVSLYQLTIEPETPYAALHAAGRLVVPDQDVALALYEITQNMTAARDMGAYEISNHAAPGQESRHNLVYWRYGEYAGVGPGAHGRLLIDGVRHATDTVRGPEDWCALVERQRHGRQACGPLTPSEQADEMLLMGLRLSEGVDLARLARIGGVEVSPVALEELVRTGLLETLPDDTADGEIAVCLPPTRDAEWSDLAQVPPKRPRTHGRVRATGAGRFILNELVLRLSHSFISATGAQDNSPSVSTSRRDASISAR